MHNAQVLLGDVGGTRARFALVNAADNNGLPVLDQVQVFSCVDFPDLGSVLAHYLQRPERGGYSLQGAVLAVAAPVAADTVHFSNSSWQFQPAQLASVLGCPLFLLNDFEAQAWCLTRLESMPLLNLQQGQCRGGSCLIIGPGTGLGVGLCTAGGEVIATEAGHMAWAPGSPAELLLLQQLWQWYPHLTLEHLLSGPGLSRIYAALSCLEQIALTPAWAPDSHQILEQASQQQSLACNTLGQFSALLGAACGDLALAHGARAGVVLSGGLLQALGSHFDQSRFLEAFNDKGDFSNYCREIPVSLLQLAHPGLVGAALHARSRGLLQQGDET